VVLGVLAVLLGPAALYVQYVTTITLIQSTLAIPFVILLGLAAIFAAKRALRLHERTIGRVGGVRLARWGRRLGWFALFLGTTAALALAFWGVLSLRSH
jgi:hypothetical protein